ncbi:MAG: hypothetical protein A3F75_12390 [Betaproteobacteria bacterium RIFCSPLOWO2_12_FULL_64_23]|nr:MAG: hypothetical protein A3F75_12390 [Betaproteobacteria bacterium RIFCSPLOWO2_12_FULL_64_23]
MTGASDAEVIALLARYQCPTPFHEVRTRFLGNIASPVMAASPLETLKQLWGGELPEFDSMEAVNELLNALIAGLWNRLAEHQSSRNPFRLIRFEVAQTREGVKHLALVRRQELDGFVEGLFGPEKHINLPERAHKALGVLAEIRAMLAGVINLLDDSSKPAEPDDLKDMVRNIQKLTIIVETEMNTAILSCTRARRQLLEQIPATKPTLH